MRALTMENHLFFMPCEKPILKSSPHASFSAGCAMPPAGTFLNTRYSGEPSLDTFLPSLVSS